MCFLTSGDVSLADVQSLPAGTLIIAWQVNVDPDAQAYADANGMTIITGAQISDVWNAVSQFVAAQQGGVLANDTDAYGNPLTAQLVNGPANGQLTFNADGTFSYIPNPGFTGQDAFTYTASDGMYTSSPAIGHHYRLFLAVGRERRLHHYRGTGCFCLPVG